MRFRVLIVLVFVFSALQIFATKGVHPSDSSSINTDHILDTDSLLDLFLSAKTEQMVKASAQKSVSNATVSKKLKVASQPEVHGASNSIIPAYIEPVHIDSLLLQANPFFIDLVFMGFPNKFKFEEEPDIYLLYFGRKATSVNSIYNIPLKLKTTEQIIADLRFDAREEICRTGAHLFLMSFDQLPDPDRVKSRFIKHKSIDDIMLVDENKMPNVSNKKLVVKREKLGPWQCRANSMLQFSQNMASDNWYQGGNSTMAVLGILTGQLNYDNKKGVQFENNAEWRMGFNAVFNDENAKRPVNTNDDVLRFNSKLGVRASDNFFYSSSVDFSTQLLKNYKGINSTELKASFLSPVRLNIGVGMDYKFKKSLSLMLAPVSYKYIYVLEDDPAVINPNLFGIKKGENHLSEIGSSFRAQYSASPFKELQINSRLMVYTNYEKVEIDLEIVGNFVINRFLSTRLSLNPRYDNTVIGEKAKVQFKELLSFGFSYRLLK